MCYSFESVVLCLKILVTLVLSRGNVIVLKWQNMHVISNIKYTAIYIYIYITKHGQAVTLNSEEAYSEPFPTLKQGAYLIGGNYFTKNSILDV